MHPVRPRPGFMAFSGWLSRGTLAGGGGLPRRRHRTLRNAELLLQRAELVCREVPPFAWTQPFRSHPGESCPREAHDAESRRLAHATHLLIAPFGDRQLEPRFAAFVPKQFDLGRKRLAVIEHDAAPPTVQVIGLHFAEDLDDVGLRHRAARMGKSLGKVPVVRCEEHTTRVEIETPDWVDACRDVRQELAYRRPSLWVIHRRDDAPRLVKKDVDGRLRHDAAPVDLHLALAWIDFCPEFRYDVSIDPDAPGRDELLGSSTRRYARVGEHFL